MATFSVDITDVVFAGTRTGYKDIESQIMEWLSPFRGETII